MVLSHYVDADNFVDWHLETLARLVSIVLTLAYISTVWSVADNIIELFIVNLFASFWKSNGSSGYSNIDGRSDSSKGCGGNTTKEVRATMLKVDI